MAANPPNSAPPPANSGQRSREAVTAALALAVAAIALTMLSMTFAAAKAGSANVNAMKDVLQYGMSLLGAVIGYYFGRVPAELHAAQAKAGETRAIAAQAQLSADVRAIVPAAIAQLQSASQHDALIAAAAAPAASSVSGAVTDLRTLLAKVP